MNSVQGKVVPYGEPVSYIWQPSQGSTFEAWFDCPVQAVHCRRGPPKWFS